MPVELLTKAEREVLVALNALNETPGTMLKRDTLKKKWCGASVGRGEADLELAIRGLLSKGMLRENVTKTMVGFTAAGYRETTV